MKFLPGDILLFTYHTTARRKSTKGRVATMKEIEESGKKDRYYPETEIAVFWEDENAISFIHENDDRVSLIKRFYKKQKNLPAWW
jgi:hypothetical protein